MTESDTAESSEPPGGRSTETATECAAATVDLADPGHRLNPPARAWLRDATARALLRIESTGEARIRIVGDEEIARAHEEYLGEPGTTDVITFDMSEGDEAEQAEGGEASGTLAPRTTLGTPAGLPGRCLDTDILICFDEAARQSTGRGHPVEHELLLYIVHGLLHCLGHDDHEPEAADRMHEAEDRVLSALGIGATYSRPAAPSEGETS